MIGQFAIRYFILEYDPAYVVGAIIIACAAVTIALSIFFKLREKWANQWYKRLGCAMLMAVAVTGKPLYFLVGYTACSVCMVDTLRGKKNEPRQWELTMSIRYALHCNGWHTISPPSTRCCTTSTDHHHCSSYWHHCCHCCTWMLELALFDSVSISQTSTTISHQDNQF